MVDSFNPQPWQSPTRDGVQRPMSVQTTTMLPADASQADTGVLMRVANDLVSSQASRIHRFISNQRQQVSISGLNYVDQHVKLDGVRARYRYNLGQERLEINVYPVGGGGMASSRTEINLDGYIIWVHAEPNYPDLSLQNQSQSPGPYLIALNGYIIEQAYQPVVNQTYTGGYPILFGKTALLASSYVGDTENLDPLTKNSQLKQPLKVLPSNGWGNYDDGLSPSGVDQSKIPKTLGYWLFDWFNPHNPGIYIGGQNWATALASKTGAKVGAPVFTKGTYFKDPRKSPLNPMGQNSMTVLPVQYGQTQYVLAYDLFFAEFYDRGAFRAVTQSWTYPMATGQAISVNDKPLIYAMGHLSGQSV